MKRDNRLCVWWCWDDGTECGQAATHLVSQPGMIKIKMPVCAEHVAGYRESELFTVEPIDAEPNDNPAEPGTAT